MTPMSFHFFCSFVLLLVKTAAIIPCYCERCLMKHHFTRNVSALKTSSILIWSKWLAAVFGQKAVAIGNIVYLCLDAGTASYLSYVLLLVFVRTTSIHPKYPDARSHPEVSKSSSETFPSSSPEASSPASLRGTLSSPH